MGIPIIGDIISSVKDILSEVVVDKDKKLQIEAELKQLEDRANERVHAENLAQIDVNKEEAKSGSLFVAGWRPGAGWVCVAGLAMQTIILPLVSVIFDVTYNLDTELLILTLGGMLGIGGMRSFDRLKGTATSDFSEVNSPAAVKKVQEQAKAALFPPEEVPWSK